MNLSSIKKDTNYLNILNVISAIAVVIIHCNFAFWAFNPNERYWITTNIIRQICYFAVPVFFMISGATLLNYTDRYSTKEFFRKRLKKVVFPFLIWSIIGLCYCLFMKTILLSDLNLPYIINGILNSKFQDVFWYFPVCISVYLCFPLFSSVDKSKRKSVFSYVAILYLILNIIIPFFLKVFSLKISFPISLIVGTNYLFFCIAGFLINEYDMNTKYKNCIYILGLIGLLTQILGTHFASISAGKIVGTYSGYLNLPCILYSIAIFTFFKNYGNKMMNCKFVKKLVRFLNKYTFAIYLLHNFIRNYFVVTFNINTISIYWRLFSFIPIITLCVVITFVLRKIKFVKSIVPE